MDISIVLIKSAVEINLTRRIRISRDVQCMQLNNDCLIIFIDIKNAALYSAFRPAAVYRWSRVVSQSKVVSWSRMVSSSAPSVSSVTVTSVRSLTVFRNQT